MEGFGELPEKDRTFTLTIDKVDPDLNTHKRTTKVVQLTGIHCSRETSTNVFPTDINDIVHDQDRFVVLNSFSDNG